MTAQKGLILDANIILRAVFGRRVRNLLDTYDKTVIFYTPFTCFEEARKYVPEIAKHKEIPSDLSMSFLEKIQLMLEIVDSGSYEPFEAMARSRIDSRDPNDWPVVATALLLNLPIWTEDQDFFGAGIPTWTTDRIEIYLKG